MCPSVGGPARPEVAGLAVADPGSIIFAADEIARAGRIRSIAGVETPKTACFDSQVFILSRYE